MIKPSLRLLLLAVPVFIMLSLCSVTGVMAQEEAAPEAVTPIPRTYGQPDLFYNYYVPGGPGGVPAAMYLAPRPVPPLVGHTYYTYQPLMPHEYMYQHQRKYYRYYGGGTGLTRTRVRFLHTPLLDHMFVYRNGLVWPSWVK